VPLIARHFLEQIGEREGASKRFAPEVLRAAGRASLGRQRARAAQRRLPRLRDDPGRHHRRRLPARRTDAQAASVRADRSPSGVGTPLAEVERQLTLATLEHFGRPQGEDRGHARHQPEDALQPAEGLRQRRRPSVSVPGALDETR
jgi:hypothetical protein